MNPRPSMRLVALLLALFVSPLHLAVVQVAGWSYMYVSARVAGDSASDAALQTFDGSAPCAMCDLVESLAPQQQDHPTTGTLSAPQLVIPLPLALMSATSPTAPRRHPEFLPWQSYNAQLASADRASPWRPPS